MAASSFSSPPPTRSSNGSVFLFAAVDKVGSSTVQDLLASRSRRHGASSACRVWSGDLLQEDVSNGALNVSRAAVEGGKKGVKQLVRKFVAREHEHAAAMQASLADGDCVSVFCSFRWPCGRDRIESACAAIEARGLRCRVFTVLRHPVARLLSAYDYFCKGCAERGRHCAGSTWRAEETGLTCPNMTLRDYVEHFGNAYAGYFGVVGHRVQASALLRGALGGGGGGSKRAAHSDARPSSSTAAAAPPPPLAAAAVAADAWLRQRALVLFTESDLARDERPFERLGAWMGDEWVASRPRQIANAGRRPKERGGGGRVAEPWVYERLFADMWLYEQAVRRAASPSGR